MSSRSEVDVISNEGKGVGLEGKGVGVEEPLDRRLSFRAADTPVISSRRREIL